MDPADAVDVLHAFERGLSSFAHMRSVVRVSAVSVRVSSGRTDGIGGLWRLIIRVDRLCEHGGPTSTPTSHQLHWRSELRCRTHRTFVSSILDTPSPDAKRSGMLLFAVGLQAGTCTLVLSAGVAAHSPLSSTIRVHVAVLDPSPSPTLVAITQACEASAADIESSACTALPCAWHTHLVA